MRRFAFLILLFPLLFTSCGSDSSGNSSGSSSSSSSSSAGTMSSNGIQVTNTSNGGYYLNAQVICTGNDNSIVYQINALESYISSTQNKSYIVYNGYRYYTNGHLQAANYALSTLEYYYQQLGNVKSSAICSTSGTVLYTMYNITPYATN